MGAVVGDGERIESAREKTGRAGGGFRNPLGKRRDGLVRDLGLVSVMRQIAMSLAANGDTTLIK